MAKMANFTQFHNKNVISTFKDWKHSIIVGCACSGSTFHQSQPQNSSGIGSLTPESSGVLGVNLAKMVWPDFDSVVKITAIRLLIRKKNHFMGEKFAIVFSSLEIHWLKLKHMT